MGLNAPRVFFRGHTSTNHTRAGRRRHDASPHPRRRRARTNISIDTASFPDSQKQRLLEALSKAGVEHVVETYPGAKHGWVPSDSLVFDAQASDRHYQTLLALFEATLKRAPRK